MHDRLFDIYLSRYKMKRTVLNMGSHSLSGKRIEVSCITFSNSACKLKNKRHSKRCFATAQTLLLKEQ